MAREISIHTPLGEDKLRFVSMRGSEHLGRLFQFDVQLVSDDENLNINDILGQKATIDLVAGDGKRYFNGYVCQLTQLGRTTEGHVTFNVTLRPWFWLLTRTADCRIFQAKTVPDIIKEVFNDNGFSDFEDALSASYKTWEYCVQYRESDFNFVSRLMEQEGIYYFFKHSNGKHVLVMADGYNSHEPIAGEAEIAYHLSGIYLRRNAASVANLRTTSEVQPGSYTLTDYNFKKPKSNLQASRLIQRNHAEAEGEIFDYPGEYEDPSDGEQYALLRIEELHVNFQKVEAETDARMLNPGGLFKLTEHPRSDQNKEYLIIGCDYELSGGDYASGGGESPELYKSIFAAIDSKTTFRSARNTRKPIVQGPQTAVVVGPGGEEIYPDEFGRVKVQFHWDRYGSKNQSSSCWVRVSQSWAGAGWGAQFIPRVGHEVIVNFLEGDPDRPIITGRVYNADNMPPYSLPANKTQSGIKSRSSPGGSASNCNEIRMEDKKGSEELFIQAEKDEVINVKNNKTETVGVDETVSIGNNEAREVGNDQTLNVGNNQTETVGANQTISVGGDQSEAVTGNRTESVGANETLSVASDRSRTVGGSENVAVSKNRTHSVLINETIVVGAAQEIAVGGAQLIAVGAAQAITVGAIQTIDVIANQSIDVGINQSVGVGSNQSIKVGGNRSLKVGKNRSANVADDDNLKVGKNLVIDAGDSVLIKCGKASISMKNDGTINIDGKGITVNGSGKIDIKASKDVTIKGKKVLQN